MANSLASAVAFLSNYRKRDTVFRTAQFGAFFLGGLSQGCWPSLAEKLFNTFKDFSQARLVLRMIDDIPMLAYTLKCSLSREEPDKFLYWSTLLSNLSILIYYPLEHLIWLSDLKFTSLSSEKLWKYAIFCWVLYSAIQIVQIIYKLWIIHSSSKQKVSEDKSTLQLGLLQYICDLLCGLNWMGFGPLHNKLSFTSVGLLGTVSSIVQLHRSLQH